MEGRTFLGIDLSKHNRVNNWLSVSKEVDFCILRAGGNFNGYYKDPKFEAYYMNCKKFGIPVGAYYDAGMAFYGSLTGSTYAAHFMKLLEGKTFEMPVYIDIEVVPKSYKNLCTDAAISFCKAMEDAGYFVGIYGSDINTFAEMLDIKRIKNFSLWVARYNARPKYVTSYQMWQYTSKGTVNGIQGYVDRDETHLNYPIIMKGAHKNGY